MELTILAFAHTRESLGFSRRTVTCQPGDTPRTILAGIAPDAGTAALAVAIDGEYSSWDQPVGPAAKELALIPPVSGG